MSNQHSAPSHKSTVSVAEFRRVATPWVAFVAEQPNDIAGQNADPDGTIEDSVDISDPNYDEKKTRNIEIEYAEEDHLEPPIHVNTLDDEAQKSDTESITPDSPNEQNPDQKEPDPAEAAALVDMSEIYEPKDDEDSA